MSGGDGSSSSDSRETGGFLGADSGLEDRSAGEAPSTTVGRVDLSNRCSVIMSIKIDTDR